MKFSLLFQWHFLAKFLNVINENRLYSFKFETNSNSIFLCNCHLQFIFRFILTSCDWDTIVQILRAWPFKDLKRISNICHNRKLSNHCSNQFLSEDYYVLYIFSVAKKQYFHLIIYSILYFTFLLMLYFYT